MDLELRAKLAEQGYWEVPDGLDTSNFDFSWRPFALDRPYIHQFGTQHQKTGGPKFVIPQNEGIKYQDHQIAIKLPDKDNRCWRPLVSNASIDFSWHPDDTEPPFIYVFGNQWYNGVDMPTYQYRVKGATDKKYIDDIKATLLPNKDKWEIPEDIEDDFDYSWVPSPHEPNFIWQFGTQWQKTGGPRYISDKAIATKFTDALKAKHKYLLRNWRVVESIHTSSFDFSWHPDSTEIPYNYVFGNEYHSPEKMPTVVYRVKGASEIKYINEPKAKLIIESEPYTDSIFDSVRNYRFDSRYSYFGDTEIDYSKVITDDEHVHVHIIDDVAAIVPKEAKSYLVDKITDYPYVKHHSLGLKAEPLDIIFISNGEEGCEENYQHLLSLVKGLPNRVIGIKGINGRVLSQHEAAAQSTTPWYFLVNGKLKVNENFDFSWQPNRLASRKHYVFTATNPVNGLEYGHMAMVANNKKITLETTGVGLDFTLDGSHEIVNINSGIGMFNTSAWDSWRTTFREVIKLKRNVETMNDFESNNRLEVWLTKAEGQFAQNTLQGAKDAVEYYESVDGDFQKLKLSYDWEWLKERYQTK